MAEQNPIKYSDLISPDDSIEKLITQLEQLSSVYTGMAESIKSQAQGVAASLKMVSGATVQGQQATKNAASEADKLAKAYRDLNFSRSETARKIAELKMAQKEEKAITKYQTILNNTEAGSYAHLAAQYALNKMALNQMTAAERENLPHAKKLEEETKKIYEEMKRLQEATGKYTLNVGNYENAITSAIGVNTRWYQGIQQIGALFEGGFSKGLQTAGTAVAGLGRKLLALMANPIVLTITGITAAFMALSKGISSSEENTNALMRILSPFQRILTGVLNVLQNVAGWILRGVEGAEKLAMAFSRLAEKLPVVGSQFKKVNDELQKNINLTIRKQQLEKDQRQSDEKIALIERNIAKFRADAAKTSDPARRAQLNKMAIREEERVMNERLRLAKEDVYIKEQEAKQAQNSKEANEALSKARAKLYQVQRDYYQGTIRMNSQIRKSEEQMNKPTGGSGGAHSGGGKDTDLVRQQIDELRKLEDLRISLIEDANLRERMTIIASYERKVEDLKGSEEYITEMTLLLAQERDKKLADLFEKEAQQQKDREKKDLDARLRAIDDMEKKREMAVRNAEKQINEQYELEMSGADLERNENKKTDMRLKAEKKRLQALLSLYEKDGRTLTAKEIQILKNNIEQVDQEIEKNGKKRDVYDLLGFGMDDDQKQAMNDAFAMAIENVNAYMDAWVQAAEKKLAYADKEVDSAKKTLDAEIEARNNGYAANVALAQKELDQARKNQQKALREQQRAQKAQEMLNTATQVSSLVTASANIWSSFSSMGPWGIAAAVAAIALMFGSFAAAKIKASSIAGTGGSEEQYGEGTVELLQGGSHQSGNDIDLGRKKDGTRRRAEGGEYFAVINRRSSRRYRSLIPDVIHALNDGTFAQKYQRAYGDGGIQVSVNSQSPDLRNLSSDVRLIREQGEQSVTYDHNGNEVMRYKNLRRIIKS